MNRRLLIVLIAFVLLWPVAALLAPQEKQAVKPEKPAIPFPLPKDGSADGAVVGTLPADKVVRATVGDLVELTVTAPGPDSVEIEALSLMDAVDRNAPAHFSFLATEPGRQPVRLTLSGKTAGQVVITKREASESPPGDAPPARRGRE